jgi:hypothetical protein
MHGFSVRLDDLEGFRNGVVDFAANYELIVNQLTEANPIGDGEKLRQLMGHTPSSPPPGPASSGKAGEFSDSCEAFVTNYGDLMQLLLRINTAIKNALTKTANGLTTTHESYAELDNQNAGVFQRLLDDRDNSGGAG